MKIELPFIQIHSEASNALDKLSRLFPEGYYFTFVARTPETLDGQIVVTNDPDQNAVTDAILRENTKEFNTPPTP